MKFRKFVHAEEVCKFIKNNKGIKIISITHKDAHFGLEYYTLFYESKEDKTQPKKERKR